MKSGMKALTAALVGGVLAGCATGPYYGDPAYGYNYGYGPAYYDPLYVGPSVGFGYTYYDSDGRRHWRDDHRREWRDGNTDRTPIQPGIDYSNDYERQNLENRERLLRGHEPSGAGG